MRVAAGLTQQGLARQANLSLSAVVKIESGADLSWSTAVNTQTAGRVRRVSDGCGFALIRDLDAGKAQAYLANLKAEADKDAGAEGKAKRKRFGMGSFNGYATALKTFGNWLEDSGRAARNPFAKLTKLNAKKHVLRKRRTLPIPELQALLSAARNAEGDFRGLTGLDRFMLYSVALNTGLRCSELASLTTTAFHQQPCRGRRASHGGPTAGPA